MRTIAMPESEVALLIRGCIQLSNLHAMGVDSWYGYEWSFPSRAEIENKLENYRKQENE